MSNNLFGFKSKKERDDFYIALVVVLLFFFLFGWLYTKNNTLNLEDTALASVGDTEVVESVGLDADGDGVADIDDKCPDLAGDPENDGCPYDRDGDGIRDEDDKCPALAGLAANGGCPKDSDGDGVYDEEDKCPNRAWNSPNGCPPDTDGDGVMDPDDKCPNEFGSKLNNGCPMITKEEAAILEEIRNVQFVKGKASLLPKSEKELDKLLTILKNRPQANVSIHGHTDPSGNAENNLILSKDRAKSCAQYLFDNGISRTRVTTNGYGSTRPIPGVTDANKLRRVEFKLSY